MKGRHAARFEARLSTRARVGLSLISSAVAILAVLPAPQAFAVQPTCGVAVTANVRLDGDLDCTAGGDGIVVGASGITIDLNGFTVTGTSGVGVSVITFQRVKVLNGVIDGFDYAVQIDDSSSVTVDDLAYGAEASANGVYVHQSAGVTVNNVVAAGDPTATAGVDLFDNFGKVTVSNIYTSGFRSGIRIRSAMDTTTLTNNVVHDAAEEGILFDSNTGALVATGNVVLDAGRDGFRVDCNGMGSLSYGPVTITGNKVLRSGAGSTWSGFSLFDCTKGKSTISGNVSAENTSHGFYAGNLPNSTWSDNRAASNGYMGFDLEDGMGGATIKGNRSDLNEGKGFYLDVATSTPASFAGNFARGNGNTGFSPNATMTSVSSGNVAFGNGDGSDAQQCSTDITCVGHATAPLNPDCGTPITGTLVLSANLTCGVGDGLYVDSGASRVTIDLNGYTLTVADGFSGITLSGPGPTKSITVKNGVLKGGQYGVYAAANGATVTLQNVLSTSSFNGSKTYWADMGATAGGTVTATDVVSDRTSWALEAPTVIANGVLTGPNGLGPVATVLKADRLITLSTANGAFVDASGTTAASVVTNSVMVAQFPLTLFCDLLMGGSPTVKGNVVVGGIETGETPNGNGIQVSQCSGGTIANNLALDSAQGIQLDKADGMSVSGNRAYANTVVGFDIYFNFATAVFKGNFADFNGQDGFYFYDPGTPRTFSGNFARANGGKGFTAPGQIPGSGNVAFGNVGGDCVFVTCKYPVP